VANLHIGDGEVAARCRGAGAELARRGVVGEELAGVVLGAPEGLSGGVGGGGGALCGAPRRGRAGVVREGLLRLDGVEGGAHLPLHEWVGDGYALLARTSAAPALLALGALKDSITGGVVYPASQLCRDGAALVRRIVAATYSDVLACPACPHSGHRLEGSAGGCACEAQASALGCPARAKASRGRGACA